jgi:hypothetical protein
LHADHHRDGEKRDDDGRSESVRERQKIGPPSTNFEPEAQQCDA